MNSSRCLLIIYIYQATAIHPAGSESHRGTEERSLLHEEAGNRLTEKLTRQDATDPKQKAVTGYKEQWTDPPPQPAGN